MFPDTLDKILCGKVPAAIKAANYLQVGIVTTSNHGVDPDKITDAEGSGIVGENSYAGNARVAGNVRGKGW
jgi:hypothetical protein